MENYISSKWKPKAWVGTLTPDKTELKTKTGKREKVTLNKVTMEELIFQHNKSYIQQTQSQSPTESGKPFNMNL
jgi:hypothetical protein